MTEKDVLSESSLAGEASPRKCVCVHPAHGGGECGMPVKEGSNFCEGCLNDFLNDPKVDLDDYGM
jgi:hypothetical protein